MANYWRSAYESSIVAACDDTELARTCLDALTVWKAHPLRLNRLSNEEAVQAFERFCPPLTFNNRKGARSGDENGMGKGPVSDFKRVLAMKSGALSAESLKKLRAVEERIAAESACYEGLVPVDAMDALFVLLPAWCLQDRIDLVRGTWWDSADVIEVIAEALCARFREMGYSESLCRYYLDSCKEALDWYVQEVSTEGAPYEEWEMPELISLIREERQACPNYEVDGYGGALPSWLIGKEQLIWNIWACALYGPACARPFLMDSPGLMSEQRFMGESDVMTRLARLSFEQYCEDRYVREMPRGRGDAGGSEALAGSEPDGVQANVLTSAEGLAEGTFAELPLDMRASTMSYIASFPAKIELLGFSVLPFGYFYPERQVVSFSESEVECLAILEHRRWLSERTHDGWMFATTKSRDLKQSPFMVAWEELSEREREWNRSAVRSIPALLADVGLAIVK